MTGSRMQPELHEHFGAKNSAMLSGYSTFDEEFGEPLLTIGIGRKNCEIVVDSCSQQFCTAQIMASHVIYQGWVQQEGALTLGAKLKKS